MKWKNGVLYLWDVGLMIYDLDLCDIGSFIKEH